MNHYSTIRVPPVEFNSNIYWLTRITVRFNGVLVLANDNEPPEKNNPLLKSNKVFLSPHTATFTEECAERMGIETIQNIIDFFDKKLEKFRTVIL